MARGFLVVVATVIRVLGVGSGVSWGGAPEVRSLVTARPGLCCQVVALQGSGVLLPHGPAPTTCSCRILAAFCLISLFLMWVNIFCTDWPVQFPLCVLTAHSLCPFSSWAVLLCFYWLVANFNILKLNPLLRVYIADISSQAGACLFTVLALSLVTRKILILMQVNFLQLDVKFVFYLILSQKWSPSWCHKDSVPCFRATAFPCFSH